MHEVVRNTNAELKSNFEYALNWSDRMFSALQADALHQRPIPLRLPCIFYYGHLPAFLWNQVFRAALKIKSFNAEFDTIFERGIDPPDLQDTVVMSPNRQTSSSWPAVPEITRYKERIEKDLWCLLDNEHIEPRSQLSTALHMVLEHYLMHIETFFYMMHQLPYDLKVPIKIEDTGGRALARLDRKTTVSPLVSVPAGIATIGANRDEIAFGWCNEFDQFSADVDGFTIDRFPVTNQQFLEFVSAGGYENPSLWSQEGWQWLQNTGKTHPHFWFPSGARWLYRGMFEISDLNENAPVWVTHAEAQAYCKWKGALLPTEAQYHRAAFRSVEINNRAGNFGLQRFAPTSVGEHPQGASDFGVEDLLGNGWEWTSSIFAPFKGFKPIETYRGYSADFFDDRHFVLKGASPVTPKGLIRESFRNWFQPHYPYVYAKFHCVQPNS